jgi:hypothetical protein
MSSYVPDNLYLAAQIVHIGTTGTTKVLGDLSVAGGFTGSTGYFSGDVHIGGNIISNGKHINLELFHQQFTTLLAHLGFTGTTGPDFIVPI